MVNTVPDGWTSTGRSGGLHRRFEFEAYANTSEFLDRLTELSKARGLYPDLNFASRHVNVTIYADTGGIDAGSFAAAVTALVEDSKQ